ASHVDLRIYDTSGRLVATLVDGWKAAGKHQAIFDPKGAGGSDLPSGIYLAKLTAGDHSQVQKLVLLK
ncbi:MAG TPA: T9SS type A sorting domain-containing protein, partial [bacterium]